MAYGVTPQGFVKKTLLQIRDEILQYWKDNISQTINTSEDSLEAQLAGAFAEQQAEAWDAQEAEYASRDPAQAEGQALDDLLQQRGVYRLLATESTVLATVTLAAGTYAAGDLVANVVGNSAARFANDAEVISTGTFDPHKGGPGIGGTDVVLFRAESTGPVRANAGTLTERVSGTPGWTAVVNAFDATLGSDIESDPDYYARAESRGAGESTTADAIKAAIDQVEGVTFSRVYVNDNDATGFGLIPVGHAVLPVVLGGDDQEIRDAILRSKAAGTQSYGIAPDDTGTAYDSQGNEYVIGFARPVAVSPYIWLTISYDPLLYPYVDDEEGLKQALVDWADANQGPGKDLMYSDMMHFLREEIPGIYNVSAFMNSINTLGGATREDRVVGSLQYINLDTSRITVDQTAGTGYP